MPQGMALESLLQGLIAWARSRSDISGVALVGSHARGAASPQSDIDVVVLASSPVAFRDNAGWLRAIAWPEGSRPTETWYDVDYGQAWSRHLELTDATILEVTFATPDWAATTPVDPGTRRVMAGGYRILWDPQALLARLVGTL